MKLEIKGILITALTVLILPVKVSSAQVSKGEVQRFIVFELFDSVTGHGVEFEEWWSAHVSKLIATPGFSSVRSYQKAKVQLRRPSAVSLPDRMIVCEVNTESSTELKSNLKTEGLLANPALDARSARIFIYRQIEAWSAATPPLQGDDFRQLVFGNAMAGREEEFTRWYDNVHSHELVSVPGVVKLQRLAFVDIILGSAEAPPKYISMMDFRTDSIEKFNAGLEEASTRSPNPGTFDGAHAWRVLYQPMGPQLVRTPK